MHHRSRVSELWQLLKFRFDFTCDLISLNINNLKVAKAKSVTGCCAHRDRSAHVFNTFKHQLEKGLCTSFEIFIIRINTTRVCRSVGALTNPYQNL